MRVGMAGTGRMGAAIATRLAQQGHDVAVWNRTRAKAEPLAALGIAIVDSPAALAERSEVVMSILTDAPAIEAVYRGPGGFLSGTVKDKVFMEMSTVRPAIHLALAPEVERRGGAYLDCPVGGTTTPAREGRLLALAGGDAAVLDCVRPLLAQLSRRIEHVGPVGAGARVKLAMNLMMQVCWQSFGEAMALCAPIGMSHERLAEVFTHASGMSHGLAHRLPGIVAALDGEDIHPVNFDVDSVRKDMRTMIEEAEAMGVTIPIAARALACYDDASAAGRGGEDCAMIPVRLMQAAEKKVGGR